MGRVNFDPIVQNFSKRVGNFVYTSWKGLGVIRRYSKPSASQSPKQIEVRVAFSDASNLWNSLPQKIKDSWKKSVSGMAMTERNMFIKKNCSALRQKKTGIVSLADGAELPVSISAQSGDAGTIQISYSSADPAHLCAVLVKINPQTSQFDTPRFISNLNAQNNSALITGLESGIAYHLYIIACDAEFENSTRVSASAGFEITVS